MSAPQAKAGDLARLCVLGALLGIPAALLAAFLLALVHESQHWLWTDLPDALGSTDPQWYLILGLPVVGAAIVFAARRYLPGDGGADPLKGLVMGPVPLSHFPGVFLAAFATLSFGLVLGPEGPVIALGAVVGGAVASFARLGGPPLAALSLAGSFAAISALFGGPLVGAILLLEAAVGLGAALIPAMLPGFVAAGVGYTLFVGFGDWGGLNVPGLLVPDLPEYGTTQVVDLAFAVAIGIAAAGILAVVRRFSHALAAAGRRHLGLLSLLVAGGLAVGVIALVADALGADSQDVLFSGQASIPALLAESSTAIVVLLIIAKALGYSISLATGFRGGPIFPAIFLGVGLATLPVVWFDMSPTFAVAVGAAAGMAAEARLIVASMLFGTLLVGTAGVGASPGVVLAAVAAWLVTTAVDPKPPTAESPPSGDSQGPPQT